MYQHFDAGSLGESSSFSSFGDLISSIGIMDATSSGALNIIAGIVLMIQFLFAFVSCYHGYRIFRFCLAVQGFIIGAIVGLLVGLFSTGFSSSEQVLPIVLLFLFGIISALLSWFLYKVGVFLYSYAMCFVVTIILLLLCGAGSAALAVSLVLSLIYAIISVILEKYLIIFSTAIGNGAILGSMMGTLADFKGSELIFTLLFASTGVLVQLLLEKYYYTPKKKRNSNNSTNNAAVNSAQPVYVAVQQPMMYGTQYGNAPQYNNVPQYGSVPQYNNNFAPQQPMAAMPAPTPDNDNEVNFCPQCGKRVTGDAVFCERCGTSLLPEECTCPHCGKTIPDEASFCKFCGGKVDVVPFTADNAEAVNHIQ